MVAGLIAGLIAGLFGFLVGEPLLDRAIELESAAQEQASLAAHGNTGDSQGGGEEVFGRTTQKVGLFVTAGFTGAFAGGLFGLAFVFFRDRLAVESDWYRSLSLAAAGFTGVVFVPFLKYPANPPAIGDPETIGARTLAYFAMVGLSSLAVLVAWKTSGLLRERGVSAPVRQILVGMGLVAAVAGLVVGFPAAVDPGEFPAGLLWNFRLSSLGTQLIMWIALGAIFGLLCERANRESRVA
jgi:predicted cobalt transporter CbtA